MRRTSLFERHPTVASSLLLGDTVVSHTSLVGAEKPNLHPAVWGFADSLPAEQRRRFDGKCAEAALISDQLWRLDAERNNGRAVTLMEAVPHFEGAAMTSRMVRPPGDPDHGKSVRPCSVCSALLEALSVGWVG
ncbi:YwqJ-related putative deaminase [Streptomyces sp. NPDC047071]|uniref:YwqJ-related putative deaminase n=1 Tax=Streptomyces sp. NPDC047071 TaxID=3154808 RepID=UPI0034524613